MDGRPETRQVSAAGAPASLSFIEPEVESQAGRRILAGVEAVASAIIVRWRAIILLFILFLSIWLAVQAVVLVRSGIAYLGEHLPKLNELRKQLPGNRTSPRGSVTISPAPITTCWRNRSLGSDCFKPRTAAPKSPPPPIREPYGRPNSRCQMSTMDCPWY